MDFSKAILKFHSSEVERIEKEVLEKISNQAWVKQNNKYRFTPGVSDVVNHIQLEFSYIIENSLLVFAELKKRFESRKWRVQVSSKASNGEVTITLFNK